MINIDLTGNKFGRLLVIKRNGLLSNGKENLRAWECICDCGNKIIVRGRDLRTGNTKSCGCYRDEIKRKIHTKHGLSGTPIYRLWIDMKKRCSSNASDRHKRFYKNIFVCKKWHNFESFYAWAKDKHVRGLDIDRINTLKGYSPDNCKFVTRKQNAQNKKNCKWWHIDGKRFTSSSEAATYFGVVQSTIFSWCMGKRSGKYCYPPKNNCKTEAKYANNN